MSVSIIILVLVLLTANAFPDDWFIIGKTTFADDATMIWISACSSVSTTEAFRLTYRACSWISASKGTFFNLSRIGLDTNCGISLLDFLESVYAKGYPISFIPCPYLTCGQVSAFTMHLQMSMIAPALKVFERFKEYFT